jgi:hypothetical protein
VDLLRKKREKKETNVKGVGGLIHLRWERMGDTENEEENRTANSPGTLYKPKE